MGGVLLLSGETRSEFAILGLQSLGLSYQDAEKLKEYRSSAQR